MGFGFFSKSPLSSGLEARLKTWQALEAAPLQLPHYQVRYVTLAVTTTHLDPAQGGLHSLAAVGVNRGRIVSEDAFWLPVSEAGPGQWLDFLQFVGKSPLVAYQVPFVTAFLEPALKQALGLDFKPAWLDLAYLLPELFREAPVSGARLDAWQAYFEMELPIAAEVDAMTDTLVLARLLQRLLAAARLRGADNPAALLELARARRWLHGDG